MKPTRKKSNAARARARKMRRNAQLRAAARLQAQNAPGVHDDDGDIAEPGTGPASASGLERPQTEDELPDRPGEPEEVEEPPCGAAPETLSGTGAPASSLPTRAGLNGRRRATPATANGGGSDPGFFRRVLLLTLIALLVLSFGAVIPGESRPEPEPPSVTDATRADARADALALQARARALAAEEPPGAVRTALRQAAASLTDHASLLAAPAAADSPSPASPSPSAAPSGTANSSGSAPAVPALVQSIGANAVEMLRAARDVEPGMAGLLAVVGAEQLVRTSSLADAAEVPAPDLPSVPRSGDPAELVSCLPSGPTSGGEVAAQEEAGQEAPAQEQVSALQATVSGLQRTIYAYEVATARLSDPLSSHSAERLRQHRRNLEHGIGLLESLCGNLPVAGPAYALPPMFRQAPAEGLPLVEDDLAEMYADLVSLSDDDVQNWAINMLARATLSAHQWENRR